MISNDEYFDRLPGGYKANWSMDKLFPAHKWNQGRVREAMQRWITPLGVDNTNLTIMEARPYIEMAKQYQYWPAIQWTEIKELLKNKYLHSQELDAGAEKLASGFEGKVVGNTNGVPKTSIINMFQRIQPYKVQDVEDCIKLGPE